MAADNKNNGLNFQAGIDTNQLKQDAAEVLRIISETEKKAQAEQAVILRKAREESKKQQDELFRKAVGASAPTIAKGLEALKALTPEMKKQVGIIQNFQTQLQGVEQAQKTLNEQLSRGVITQQQYNKASQGLNVKQAALNESIRKYSDTLSANNRIAAAANGSIDQRRARLDLLTKQYYALSEAEQNNANVGGKLARQIRSLDRDLSKVNNTLSGTAKGSRILTQVLATTAGLFTLNQAGRFASDIIKVRGEIEQLEVAFTTILKSKEKADALLGQIVTLAVNTPFKLTEVADAAKQLLAYGFAAGEIQEELISLGNVAAGTGSTFNEVAYAYGTLRSQGVAFARDIRQFTGRGIPIISELAKQFGVSEEKVNDLVSAGKVGFPEVQKAFQGMTGAGGVFFNLMQEQSKTVTGLLSNLQDSIELMFNSIGKGNEGFIKDGIAGLGVLVDNYEKVLEVLGLIATVYGSYRAALLLTIAAQRLSAVTSGALTAAQVIQAGQTAILTKATALWGAAMNALPLVAITTLLTVLTTSIIAWRSAVDGATAAAENLKRIQDEGSIAQEKEKQKIEELISVLNSEVATIAQKEAALKSIQKILGPYIEGYTLEEIAAGKAQKAIESYTKALGDSVAQREAFEKYQELGNEIIELEKKGTEALGFFQQFGQSLRNSVDFEGKTFGEGLKGIFFTEDEEAAARVLENLKIQREELKKSFDFTSDVVEDATNTGKVGFEGLIGDTSRYFETLIKIATDKAQLEQIKQGLQDQLEALAPNDPQIAKIKEQILKTNEVLKAYSLTAENKEIKNAADERKKILEEISKLEEEAFKKSFSKRDQEIETTKKQFADLRAEAEKAGLGAGVLQRIDNLQQQTTGAIVYRDDTEILKEELARRKALYAEMDKFAANFGIQAAEDRYGKEFDIAKGYLDLIQSEYNKISLIDPAQRTGAENERFEYLEKEVQAEKKFQREKYDDFLTTVQDYEAQRAGIIERYALERQELIEKGDTGYLAQLEKNYKDELGQLDDQNVQKLKSFQTFFNGLENLSVKASKQLIADLRKTLQTLKSEGRITEGFYNELINALDKADIQTGKRIPDNLKQIAQGFRTISQELGGANSGIGRMLGLLGDSLERVVAIKEGLADFKAAQEKGDGLGSAVAGLGVIGAIAGIFIGIAKAFKDAQLKQIDIQKKQLELQRQIYFGELDINRLQRERALLAAQSDESTLKNLLKQKETLADNYKQIKNDLKQIEDKFNTEVPEATLSTYINRYKLQRDSQFANLLLELEGLLYDTGETFEDKGYGLFGLFSKTTKIFKDLSGLSFDEIEDLSLKGQLTEPAEKLFQELKKLKEEGIEVEAQMKALEDQLKSIFTGGATSLGIADTIIAGFQQGKRAVEDFGDSVEEILRNAILSGFKYRFLEEPLNSLLEQLYNDAVSDDDLSQSEVANFQKAFGDIVEKYSQIFEDLQTSTGVDLTGALANASSAGLSAGIRRELTEETASELAGLWRGQYDITKRHYQVAIDSLAVQSQIEANTFATTQELKQAVKNLDLIVKNTDQGSSRGLGYDGG